MEALIKQFERRLSFWQQRERELRLMNAYGLTPREQQLTGFVLQGLST